MQNFIKKVIIEVIQNNKNLQNITFISSSKRSTVFIKNYLKETLKENSFYPNIKSIEEFIEEVSEINVIDSIEILFKFYEIYQKNTKKEYQEPFEKFIAWANILLNDFNEIDRYLINADAIFTYLSDIKRIESWFEENNKTKLSKNYVDFFKNVHKYYHQLQKELLKQHIGYQGLSYRKAFENIENFVRQNKKNKFIFIGLNALNKAEENIIQKLLHEGLANIYFDLDNYLAEHQSSYAKFINKYKENWLYFNNHPFQFISDDFRKHKNIEIIGVPKNVSQIKEANSIISKITKNEKSNLTNTALVLANESLLPITLNSLPKSVSKVNITMGYPLKFNSTTNFIKSILTLYKNQKKLKQENHFYYKDVVNILSDKTLQSVYEKFGIDINTVISEKIISSNKVFISLEYLKNIIEQPDIQKLHQLLFLNNLDISTLIEQIITVLETIIENTNNSLTNEYLIRLHQIFNQILLYNNTYHFINEINTLISFFNEIINTENLSFQGEPLDGLQIMGMLETRNLDFENIIVTSVNEGFLPSGKTASSFIPFDVKKEIGLPTSTEKDAIFSYHFFRLLQRAKNIYLLYNTETDDFGASEKSRFLLQLEQLSKNLNTHQVIQKIVSPNSTLKPKKEIIIHKNDKIINKIEDYNVNKGFSPSALTTYIANPIYFYQQRILGIKDTNEIEETIALNTLGNVIHEVLEDFYKPFINKILIAEDIIALKNKVENKTKFYFEKNLKNNTYKQGKNLLIYEVTKQYIHNFLNHEIASIKKGNEIIILALEKELKTSINLDNRIIHLRGFADRIEKFNGITRIIDYKTGKVEQRQLNPMFWEESREHYKKYSKRFQLFFYAYCYSKQNNIDIKTNPIESGVISFKNLKQGFLKVDKNSITPESLNKFEMELIWLLKEIYNQEIPFIENQNPPF